MFVVTYYQIKKLYSYQYIKVPSTMLCSIYCLNRTSAPKITYFKDFINVVLYYILAFLTESLTRLLYEQGKGVKIICIKVATEGLDQF